MSPNPLFIGLGEVLWDLLPSGKQLGGAPANFAFHAAQLGHPSVVASRVGDDDLGHEILDQLRSLGLSSEGIQRDAQKPTGTVHVDLDAGGQPRYTIVEDVAWDHLAWTEDWASLSARARVVCFGSLAQRSPVSSATITRFLEACPADALRIFDINLRQHYFTRETVERGLRLAQLAKLNDEELPRVIDLLSLPRAGEESMARALLSRFDLRLVVVTRGAQGSLLVSPMESAAHPGVRVDVADTVGSGDAFVAAVAHHLLKGSSLDVMGAAANRLGAFVASRPGATPKIDPSILTNF